MKEYLKDSVNNQSFSIKEKEIIDIKNILKKDKLEVNDFLES
jgi:hypothetical protein